MNQPRVAAIGPVNVDLFIRGAAPTDLPALRSWVGPSVVDLVAAGSIGYTAQVFARLGWSVDLCTAVGDDAFGLFLRTTLANAGLGCEHVVTSSGETAIAIYVLLFGDPKRPLTYRLPGFLPWPDPPPIFDGKTPLPDLVHSGGLLHFPEMAHRGLASVFAEARRRGILTSIDPQFPLVETPAPWLPRCDDVLAQADILLCDEHEARAIFGVQKLEAAIEAAHHAGPKIVVVKRGANGSVASDRRRMIWQPPVAVSPDKIREAIGAGDAFDAGFLDALARGHDLEVALRRATATAALSLSGRGGAESVGNQSAVEATMRSVPPAEVAIVTNDR